MVRPLGGGPRGECSKPYEGDCCACLRGGVEDHFQQCTASRSHLESTESESEFELEEEESESEESESDEDSCSRIARCCSMINFGAFYKECSEADIAGKEKM